MTVGGSVAWANCSEPSPPARAWSWVVYVSMMNTVRCHCLPVGLWSPLYYILGASACRQGTVYHLLYKHFIREPMYRRVTGMLKKIVIYLFNGIK